MHTLDERFSFITAPSKSTAGMSDMLPASSSLSSCSSGSIMRTEGRLVSSVGTGAAIPSPNMLGGAFGPLLPKDTLPRLTDRDTEI